MAIRKSMDDKKLQLRLENGVNPSGKPIFRNMNCSQLKNDAGDEVLMAAAKAIHSLQTLALSEVRVIDTMTITEE
ncbi:MAG: DUF1659 domain-containing protein [Dialister sp.]|nr:DUF1659 domain-containing protein [Dialister sp.]